jgi:hypothetical protein
MATTNVDKIRAGRTPKQANARARLENLIAESGARPLSVQELDAMGDLWPEQDNVDDFLDWREEMRRQENSRRLP